MFDQCMGDDYNSNQYFWEHSAYEQYGQWPYDGCHATPWYNQCPYNNWNWYAGYNNYGQAYPPCHHYHAENHPNIPLLNDPNSEYKLYQRRLTDHYMKQEASSMTDPPPYNSIKIDCCSANMDMHKTQSELLANGSRFSINKSTRRKNYKRRFSGTARSTTTMKNSHSKLGRKVYLNGGSLAYILFKPKETESDEQSHGDNTDVPSTYYHSKKRHDMEKEFFENIDRPLDESEQDESQTSKSNVYINNFNKLYADIKGGLGNKTKSAVSHYTPEELAEIRQEFEVIFNKNTSTSKQTQTKLKMKMKALKSSKTKGRMKWTLGAVAPKKLVSDGKQTTEIKKHTSKDIYTGLKSKKTNLSTVREEPPEKQCTKDEESSKTNRLNSNNNNNVGKNIPIIWYEPLIVPTRSLKSLNFMNPSPESGRSVSYLSKKPADDSLKTSMKSTFAKFPYSTSCRKK